MLAGFSLFAALFSTLGAASARAQAASDSAGLKQYLIPGDSADPSLKRFAAPSYVVFSTSVRDSAPLLIFLPGTNGEPRRSTMFANTAAHQGYRVISLNYNDTPAVQQVCPPDPDPRCAELFREKRIFGTGSFSKVDDNPDESIAHRLVMLLRLLDREHPAEHWGQYLHGNAPSWERIAVSGLSQGAGMAAFIAQRTSVARVILFSSPWDNYGRAKTMAPWITRGHGATPSDRWYGAYHAKEPTADLIQRSYNALGIPRGNVRVFTLEPNGGALYHPSGVANGATPRGPDGSPAYLSDWKFLLGTP